MPLLDQIPLPLPLFFSPGEYVVEEALSPAQKAGCFALRKKVFCDEQQIFKQTDRDEFDAHCLHLAASSCLFGHADEIVGTVRIHEASTGTWWGSRLAVAKPYRRVGGLGAALIRLAVGTAKARGAENFLAHVQMQNQKLFEELNWHVLDSKTLHGKPHLLMQARLAEYEALHGACLHLLARPALP